MACLATSALAQGPTPLSSSPPDPRGPRVAADEIRVTRPVVPNEAGVLRVAEEESWPGYADAFVATYGFFPDGAAIRFDPADSFDIDGSLPRPFDVLRIRFEVEAGEPTGPLTVQVAEDNGGHKPDTDAILFETNVMAGPGETIVDLVALGETLRIDPPRMVHVVFRGQGGSSPRVAADDGLPFVGGSGDFHTSINYVDQNCNVPVFGFAPPSDGDGQHSSNLMVKLDVDFVAPEPEPLFVRHPTMPGCTRCAWGDVDGDGDVDALDSGRRLYLNDGAGGFEDVSDRAMPAGLRSTNGGLFGDFDRDGDLDVFAQTSQCHQCPYPDFDGPVNFDTILENVGDTDGDGVPELVDVRVRDWADANDAPLPGDWDPTEGAAVLDVNGDGWLDVYLANHNDWTTYEAFRDRLFVNDATGDMSFTDASAASGVLGTRLHGRGVSPADFDDDGDVDVFVSNYVLDRDLLWENQGWDEHDLPVLVDVAGPRGVRGTERSGAYGHGIGSAWGDVDADGALDLIVGNLAHSAWLCFSDTTKLFISSGPPDHTFVDQRPTSGIEYNEVHSDASFADVDNDSDLDVLITHVYDGWRTSLYENVRTSPPTFQDRFAISGIGQRSGWGSAWADFDEDGDLDVWMGGGLWVNQAVERGQAGSWLQLRLHGIVSNPHAIGARVRVEAGALTRIGEVFGARGTSSQDDFTLHFGLADAPLADRVAIRWPSGCESELVNVDAGQRLDVVEPECLVPRFRIGDDIGSNRRPTRVACAGESVTFADESAGSPVSWIWDFDGDGVGDATGATASWTFGGEGLHEVTLTVDDGAVERSVSRPVRVDVPPGAPASGSVVEVDGNFCASGLEITWESADWGTVGSGVYNLFRGADTADALSREPIARGLEATSFVDETAPPDVAWVYVVEAEDARAPGGCGGGAHHDGNVDRLVLDTGVVDRAAYPLFTTLRVEDTEPCDPGGGVRLSWEPALFTGDSGGGTYHVWRSVGGCPDPAIDMPLVTDLDATSWIDPDGDVDAAASYLVMAENAEREVVCPSRGPGGGAATSLCVSTASGDRDEAGSADPGPSLLAWKDAGAVVLDWSASAATPRPDEAWGLLVADAADGDWALLPPGRLTEPTATDVASQPLRFYRATILSPAGCPAPDPLRP